MKVEPGIDLDVSVSPEEAVVEFLNLEIPTLDDLSRKGTGLLREIREKNESLRRTLDLSHDSSYLEDLRGAEQLKNFIDDQDDLQEKFEETRPRVEALMEKLNPLFREISICEKKIERYNKMEVLELLSSSVQGTLVIGAFDRTLTAFAELSAAAEPLINSEEPELVEFAKKKVLDWYNLLKDKVTEDFEESLKAINWPFLANTTSRVNASGRGNEDGEKDVLLEFRTHFLQLLHLKIPDSMSDTSCYPEGAIFRDWRPVCLPILMMIRPLRKRFYFHFYGNRKTNNLEKPEWYISQVMSWIKDHGPFLSSVVQPYVDTLEGIQIDVRMEFTRGLLAMVLEKLGRDLPEVISHRQEGAKLFPHYVDEILGLEKEINSSQIGYPAHLPSPVDLLMEEQSFQSWIEVEKGLASSRLDEMLTPSGDVDSVLEPMSASFRRPACADGLLALLQSMTGRARGLRSLTRRAQFLRLQLDLLDDFRLRLRQMSRRMSPGEKKWAAILNGLFAVRDTLADWSDDMFYVELWEDPSARHLCEELSQTLVVDDEIGDAEDSLNATRSRVDSIKQMLTKSMALMRSDSSIPMENNSVFDTTIRLYSHLLQDMLNKTMDYISTDVQARSQPYRWNKWLVLPSMKKDSNIGLSPTACEMFLLLRDWLHEVSEWLEESLFQKVWQHLARRMNDLIYKQVILANRFNPGGASQLKFDVVRNLVPLFSVYTPRPEHYFRESLEAITILCLAQGTAVLLQKVIFAALHAGGSEDPLAALQDVGVFRLSADDAELVLSLRVDGDGDT